MANLCAGICSSLLVEKGAGYRGFARHRLRSTPCGGVAALPWNQWQLSPGMGGRLAMESMAALAWNRWQLWRGIRRAVCGALSHLSDGALPPGLCVWPPQSSDGLDAVRAPPAHV